ncbi:MAG TPA: hypothetical protein DDZ80_29045 [Cyanobacteria bacterium UBA8803]|nr:hypothetical protein [Cyanobacteria bacterium UBA9273]HBL62301.1 hypothetical protein [Cyanobacteria bacterium UBA8803]
MSAASTIFVLVGRAQIPPKEAIEADSTGIVLLDEGIEPHPLASGVYLGHGIVLTNWHVATYAAILGWEDFELAPEDQLLTYEIGDHSNSLVHSWICLVEPDFRSPHAPNPPYQISPTDKDNCIPYNLTQRQAFRPSNSDLPLLMPTAPLEQLIFLDRTIELAIVKLDPQKLAETKISPPCLSRVPVQRGDLLTIHSHVGGQYPAVTAIATVKDDQPKLLVDPDPRVPTQKRYAAMSIIALVPPAQANSVGPGSSGGPVFNQRGELVGLVWTGKYLEDGSTEVWITPTSMWLPRLQQANLPDKDLNQVLETPCPAVKRDEG